MQHPIVIEGLQFACGWLTKYLNRVLFFLSTTLPGLPGLKTSANVINNNGLK
jgi:hypothetical protein